MRAKKMGSIRKCPACGEEIQDEAKKCKHCGEWVEEQAEEAVNQEAAKPAGEQAISPIAAVAMTVVGVLLIILFFTWGDLQKSFPGILGNGGTKRAQEIRDSRERNSLKEFPLDDSAYALEKKTRLGASGGDEPGWPIRIAKGWYAAKISRLGNKLMLRVELDGRRFWDIEDRHIRATARLMCPDEALPDPSTRVTVYVHPKGRSHETPIQVACPPI